ALLMLLVPGRVGGWIQRSPVLGALVVPGFLVAAYTTNAQPEAYVAIVLGLMLMVALGGLDPARPTLRSWRRVLEPHELALLGLCALALFFPGTRTSELYPSWLRRDPMVACAVATVALVVLMLALAAFSNEARRWQIGIAAAIVVPLALPPPGMAGPLPGGPPA